MDGQGFDRMTRMMAGGVSRRTVLRGLAAGLAGAVGLRAGGAGAGQTKKPLCHATGDPAYPWVVISVAEPAWPTHYAHGDHAYDDCCADADCASPATCGGGGVEGQCGAPDLCQHVVCTPLDQCHLAGTCDPATGTCSNPNAPDGTACDDGDACTSGDACRAGVCTGTLINCNDGDACTIDACDSSTGQCVHQIMDCDDGIDCTVGHCDASTGQCVHTPMHDFCELTDPCSNPICDPVLGCVSEPKTCPDGQVCSGGDCVPALLGFGAACAANGECASGVCACHRLDCVGGGQCTNYGCGFGGAAGVHTPAGTAGTVCTSGSSVADCAATACPAGQACATSLASGNTYCIVLA